MKPWKYEQNSFEIESRSSNKKLLSIGADTDAKLAAKLPDPVFQAIYDEYHPFYQSFSDIIGALDGAENQRKGKTLNVVTELRNLKEKLPVWQGKVYEIYPPGSPVALEFFPDDKNPFYHGTYEQRIQAVKTLADRMAIDTNPTLMAYSSVVMSVYNTLLAARQLQQQKEGTVVDFAGTREDARILLAEALYAVLAKVMYIHRKNTSRIAEYFDLSLLRHHDLPSTSIVVKGQITTGFDIPVAGALVGLQGENPPPVTTETDEHGRFYFRFNNVPPHEAGDVTFTIDAVGYLHHEQIIHVALGETTIIDVTLAQSMLRAA